MLENLSPLILFIAPVITLLFMQRISSPRFFDRIIKVICISSVVWLMVYLFNTKIPSLHGLLYPAIVMPGVLCAFALHEDSDPYLISIIAYILWTLLIVVSLYLGYVHPASLFISISFGIVSGVATIILLANKN